MIDLMCQNSEGDRWVLSLQWEPDSGELLLTDFLEKDLPDRFGNLLPEMTGPGVSVSSPDDRHLYLGSVPRGSNDGQIVVFERINNESAGSE